MAEGPYLSKGTGAQHCFLGRPTYPYQLHGQHPHGAVPGSPLPNPQCAGAKAVLYTSRASWDP